MEAQKKLVAVYGWYMASSKEQSRGISEESILKASGALNKLRDKF